MAGITPNYSLDYPTSGDLVRNGATAMQTLATDVDTVLSTFGELTVESIVAPGTPSTTASTSYIVLAGNSANTITRDLGPSGVAIVILTADLSNSGAFYTSMGLAFTSTGFTQTVSQYRAITVGGTVRQTGTAVYLIKGDANSSVVIAPWWRTSGGTGTAHSTRIHTMNIG